MFIMCYDNYCFNTSTKDTSIGRIDDLRYKPTVDITDGKGMFADFVYTLKTDDITSGKKPRGIPYTDRIGNYDELLKTESGYTFISNKHGVTLNIVQKQKEIIFDLKCENDLFSQFGIFLPFNNMSSNYGDWKSQFLLSSPYHTIDSELYLLYLTRPDGNNIACIVENPIDGYRINYTETGSFVRGIELLSQYDRAYMKKNRLSKRIILHMVAVSSYEETLLKASEIWKVPAVYYDIASVKIGQKPSFNYLTDVDFLHIINPSGREYESLPGDFIPDEYGIYSIVPVYNNIRGIDCKLFVFDELKKMFYRSCIAVPQQRNKIIGKTNEGEVVFNPPHITLKNGSEDYNLCEHCMWAWSDLRYMLLSGVSETISGDVINLLNIILCQDDKMSINRCSVSINQGYLTYNSNRIQEVYNGVNILIDAYKLYKNRKYLEFAITILTNRLQKDTGDDGGIYRRQGNATYDYTTVTLLVFPIVDLAMLLKHENDNRYVFFEDSAKKVADFIVKRGLHFPTESSKNPDYSEEREDGSISCSALSVLYVARFLEPKPAYLQFAKDLLKIHDAWTAYTQHPVLFHSSLRWWETFWEGNQDGFAFCYGHAWSVWKAEAQYLFGLICDDEEYLLYSYNGLMGNLAKTDINGNMYSIYQYESISSGGFATESNDVFRGNAEGFPANADYTISRYAYARAYDTWFKTLAIIKSKDSVYILGGHVEGNMIIPDVPQLEYLFIGSVKGKYLIKAKDTIRIFRSKFCDAEISFVSN